MSKETLQILKENRKTGEVTAIHTWPTGYQLLLFPNRDRFNARKSKIEAK